MLLDKLKEKENFSEIEQAIIDYILKNKQKISTMSIRELAKATYTSPATIVRLCQKVDMEGYLQFRIELNSEIREAIKFSHDISENLPFQKEDTLDSIAHNLANISIRGIQESLAMFDYPQLEKIISALQSCKYIDIYGEGSSLLCACEFKSKMNRLGKPVFMEESFSAQKYQAANSEIDHIAILISHSGERDSIIKIAKILKQKKIITIAITSKKENAIQTLAKYHLYTGSNENQELLGKLETFSSHIATAYVLNCLYSFLYTKNYNQNLKRTQRNEKLFEDILK